MMRPSSRGSAAIDLGDGARRVLEDRRQHRHVRVALERPLAGRHLVEHDAQREDVRARDRPACLPPARATCRPPCPSDAAVARQVLRRQRRRHASLRLRPRAASPGRSRAPSRGRRAATMTLAGFRSRCVMPRSCAAPTASASGIGHLAATARAAVRPSASNSAERLPLDQLHRQEADVAVDCSTEWIVTMFGWLSAATAAASRSKRSRRSGSAAIAAGQHLERDRRARASCRRRA